MGGPLPLMDLIEARTRRDAGMEQVKDHQGDDWRSDYRALANAFIFSLRPGDEFTGEALRLFCLECGLGEPTHPNAWAAMAGGAIRAWLRHGQVQRCGWRQACAVASHASSLPLYRRA